jgi:hypothetical protein
MSMKNPLTPAGIEPVTFWFVAQHLNHCATQACIVIALPLPSPLQDKKKDLYFKDFA